MNADADAEPLDKNLIWILQFWKNHFLNAGALDKGRPGRPWTSMDVPIVGL